MDIKSQIEYDIRRHMVKFNLSGWIGNNFIEHMTNRVLSGDYAFQLIYDDTYRLSEYKVLDRSKIKSMINIVGETLYSYDGSHFQWSQWETLIIDQSIIRQIKLEKILK